MTRIIGTAVLTLMLTLTACNETKTSEINEPTSTAESADATMNVSGLSCPLCATNVDLALKEVPGVDGALVDMNTGRVYVDFAPGSSPSHQEMTEAVEDAGFTVHGVEGGVE